MAKSQLQWKRQVNTLRYLYRELELMEEVVEGSTPEFLQYYHQFCKQHDIQPMRGPPGTESSDDEPELPFTGSTSMIESTPSKEYINDEYGNWQLRTEEEAIHDDLHKTFTKVFRSLAYHLHPDRLASTLPATEHELRLKMFKKARPSKKNIIFV